MKVTERIHVKKLTQDDKDEVINIYNDDEVSYSLPDIKYARPTLHAFYFEVGLCSLCKKNVNYQRIVVEKMFERLKPKNVRTVQETTLRDAKCEYCANFGKN